MIDWLPDALALEAEGVSRRQIAVRLGRPFGTINRGLWEHHNPDKVPCRTVANGGRQSRRKSRQVSFGRPAVVWNEAALTETWADRKARRKQEHIHG